MSHQPLFYPLTPDSAARLRAAKLTAAEWNLWSYLVTLDPFGDRYQSIDPVALQQELDISKATFYRAIAKFQENDLFDFQVSEMQVRNLAGVKNSLKNENPASENSLRNETASLRNETAVAEMKPLSQKRDEQSSESLCSNTSRPLQTLKNLNTNQNEREEENFIPKDFREWLDRKRSRLPVQPEFVEQWISSQAKDPTVISDFVKWKSQNRTNVPPNNLQKNEIFSSQQPVREQPEELDQLGEKPDFRKIRAMIDQYKQEAKQKFLGQGSPTDLSRLLDDIDYHLLRLDMTKAQAIAYMANYHGWRGEDVSSGQFARLSDQRLVDLLRVLEALHERTA